MQVQRITPHCSSSLDVGKWNQMALCLRYTEALVRRVKGETQLPQGKLLPNQQGYQKETGQSPRKVVGWQCMGDHSSQTHSWASGSKWQVHWNTSIIAMSKQCGKSCMSLPSYSSQGNIPAFSAEANKLTHFHSRVLCSLNCSLVHVNETQDIDALRMG